VIKNTVNVVKHLNRLIIYKLAQKIPCIHIMNKVDKTTGEPRVDIESDGRVKRIWLSAQTGDGLDLLRETLKNHFREEMVQGEITLHPEKSRLRAALYALGAVQHEEVDDNGNIRLRCRLSKKELNQLSSKEVFELLSPVKDKDKA